MPFVAFLASSRLPFSSGRRLEPNNSFNQVIQAKLRAGRSVTASVRYIVNDMDKIVDLYRDRLGFEVKFYNSVKFASMKRDDLSLLLNAPGASSAGKAGGNSDAAKL